MRSRRAASREPGQKTMLDVLYPVQARRRGRQEPAPTIADAGRRGGRSDDAVKAIRGRASFLGDRSIGHMDAGARSTALIVRGIAETLETRRMKNVGIVIVSHSPKVAEGTADMVRQMVGDEVPLAWCGGNADGGLGTQVGAIMEAIDKAWSEAGVAILVDLGGAETNSEMAIEMIGEPRSQKIVICNAPIVEGAVMAATEASGGASLKDVVADGGRTVAGMSEQDRDVGDSDQQRSRSPTRSACMRGRR